MSQPLLSIVIPCYNEEEVLPISIPRFLEFGAGISGMDMEFIFVDDGSGDGTREILKREREKDDRIKILGFARNFGHQVAVSAGLDVANGDAIVIIDADLQDPPEVVYQMIEKWREGFDVVYGTRIDRPGESWFKLFSAKYFYRVLNFFSDVSIPNDTGDFRLISKRVADVLRAMPERHRFIRGMVSWVGFRQISLPYKREDRKAGESKYPLGKMVKFALDGILSFSTKPLKISIAIGLMFTLLAFLGGIYVLLNRLFTSNWVAGWTTMMLVLLFMGGLQFVCLGVLGEYVGRIYRQTQGRPLYTVQEVRGVSFPEKYSRPKANTECPADAGKEDS